MESLNIMNSKTVNLHFFSLAAVCIASSCASDRPDNTEGAGLEVSFATSGVTRASVTTDINTEGSGFIVFGDMLRVSPESSDNTPTLTFFKTEVEYDGKSWHYDDIRYWLPNYEYSFVAIHPVSLITKNADNFQYGSSGLSCTYSIPVAEDNVLQSEKLDDLIAANHRRRVIEGSSTSILPVNLRFFHILTRINFLLKYEGSAEAIRVTEIELDGVNKSGTFTLTPAPISAGGTQTDDYTLVWSDHSEGGTIIAPVNAEVSSGQTQTLFPDDNALFMIPQPDNKDIIMKITYICDNGDKPETQTLTAQAPIGGWEAGKIYSYSLAVNIEEQDKDMRISVDVKDWKEGESSEILVPRK